MGSNVEHSLVVVLQECINRANKKYADWISLLPDEYKNDVYGVPWPTIILSLVLGLVLIWVLLWRSSVSKQIRKERSFVEATEELRGQLHDLLSEKLETENKFMDLNKQMKKIVKNLENEKRVNASSLIKCEQLETALEKLQQEYDFKVDEIDESNKNLENLNKENQGLNETIEQIMKQIKEQKDSNKELSGAISDATKRFEESEKHKKEIKKTMKQIENKLNQAEIENENQKVKLKEWEEQSSELQVEVCALKEQVSSLHLDNQHITEEADVLKDCLLQLQVVQKELTEDGDEDLENEELVEKQKEKLKGLVDVSHVRKLARRIETEKEQALVLLETEKKSREKSEARIIELEADSENIRRLQEKTEQELHSHKTKINILEEYYAKRDVEMQGKLGKEHRDLETKQSELAQETDKIKALKDEVLMYKKMYSEQCKQFEENEKKSKMDMGEFEKKAHTNWLAFRDAESKREDSVREANQLRTELKDMQRRLHDMEAREAHRPWRIGPLEPPFRGFSPPIHMSLHSTTESLRSDGAPDRIPSRSQGERRSSLQNNLHSNEPVQIGDGVVSGGSEPHREPPVKGSPLRGGSTLRSEPPLPDPHRMRSLHGPRFGGREPFLPGRDGPPLMGEPPMLRDRPPHMFPDGPRFLDDFHPMMRPRPLLLDRPPSGPPPRQMDFPPRMPRPGSQQDVHNTSVNMDRSLHHEDGYVPRKEDPTRSPHGSRTGEPEALISRPWRLGMGETPHMMDHRYLSGDRPPMPPNGSPFKENPVRPLHSPSMMRTRPPAMGDRMQRPPVVDDIA